MVPTKRQWIAESIYGFVRENIAKELIGHEGVRFAPYFTTLFCFILLTNLFGLIPGIQISPNSHIAFPDHPRGDQLCDVQLRRHPQVRLRQVLEALARSRRRRGSSCRC